MRQIAANWQTTLPAAQNTRDYNVISIPISQEALEEAVEEAAERDDVDALRFLFSAGRTIGQRALGWAVEAAAQRGNIHTLRFLLSEGRTISQEALRGSLRLAAKGDFIESMKFLLSEGRTISQEMLGEIVSASAEGEHIESMKFLLSEGRTISQEMLGEIVSASAERGFIKSMRFLLSEGRTISQESWEEAVVKAAVSGHVESVRFFLSEGRTISQESWEEAVVAAARRGHVENVKVLFCGSRTISQESWERAVRRVATTAFTKDSVESLQVLLSEDRTISQKILEEVVVKTAENGSVEMLRVLLSEGRAVWQEVLERAVLKAAERGYLSIIEFLICQGPIRESVKNSAITNANTYGRNYDSIRDILRSARTVPEYPEISLSRVQAEELTLRLSDVKEQPAFYLHTLFRTNLPARIRLIDENGMQLPAVDAGGITKQFVSSLCEALVQQKQLLNLSNKGIPAKKDDSPMHEQLGYLFSLIYETNLPKTDKVLTGHVVDERFLEMVRAIAIFGDGAEGIKKVYTLLGEIDPDLQPAVHFLSNPPSQESDFLTLMDLDFDKEGIKAAHDLLRPYYLAARNFLAGTTSRFRKRLAQGNVQELACDVQGEPVTVAGLLRSLRLAQDHPLPTPYTALIDRLASQDLEEEDENHARAIPPGTR